MRLQKTALSAIAFAFTLSAAVSGMTLKANAQPLDEISPSDLFGPNVYVFDENDTKEDIQDVIDQVFETQEENQFGDERYALFFKPGTYDVQAKVGFYTHVGGLGTLPTDTTLTSIDVNAFWMQNEGGNNATCNFWRRAENFTVRDTSTWAVAQATSLRRMKLNDWIAYDQWGSGWASGGFTADTIVDGSAVAYSQQQYLTRNSDYGGWSGGVWNAVFVGMEDAVYDHSGNEVRNNWDPDPGYQYYTNVNQSPVIREQPFLTIDENDNYGVFVPNLRRNAKGVSWKNGANGTTIGIDQFYIAKEDGDTAASINTALASGKHLIFTPGIYHLEDSIKVNRENTVVLGLGYATLIPSGNHSCIEVADVGGVSISGLLFDAGRYYTEALLKVGPNGASGNHAANPTLLSDIFCRVGGAATFTTQSETCVIINSNHVIGDNFWIWRADHGDGVAWDKNLTKNGVVVNGDDVTIYGLFVEHFHEYQTLWNGENGKTFFYQSEIPYDVPDQASWMSHNGTVNGYASYKVADDVMSHEAHGLGIYSFHRDAVIDLHSAAEVPDTDGVKLYNICSVMLAGNPGISHVINNTGGAVTVAGNRQQVVQYTGEDNTPQEPEPEEPEEPVTPETNLALGKTAESSTDLGWNTADKAIDGDPGTRWESEHSDNHWISIDLGAAYDINAVTLIWETAAGKDYTIDVSTDGTNWTSVYHETAGAGGTKEITFDTVSARYVRMAGSERTTDWGFSLYEFEVY